MKRRKFSPEILFLQKRTMRRTGCVCVSVHVPACRWGLCICICCTHKYVCVFLQVCTCRRVSVHTHVCVCLSICMSTDVLLCVRACVPAPVNVHMCACAYRCACVYHVCACTRVHACKHTHHTKQKLTWNVGCSVELENQGNFSPFVFGYFQFFLSPIIKDCGESKNSKDSNSS